MKKSGISLALILGILFLASPLMGQVNQSELGNLGPVDFINYVGPYTRIETRAQIRAIGYTLGQAVKAGSTQSGVQSRYFVIHSATAQDGSKLDADVFGLGVDVGVDHIRNLRLIIQGYLEAAYGYTEKDAALLAEYITVYNAVYRGDMDYFGSRYKKPVMDNLVKEKAGLSLRYDEWPGQALIIIPMGTGVGGPLSSINTSSISDSKVTEQLRQEPDMSVDQRKNMVELKERESDQASQQASIQKEAIQQEEQNIAQQRQQAQQQQQQAQQQQQQAQQQQQQAQQQQQQAQQQQQQAQQQQQQAQQEKQQIAQERQQPGADQQALNQRDQAADQKAQEAQQQQQQAQQQQQQAQQQQQQAQQQEQQAQQQQQQAQQQQQQLDQQQQAVNDQKQAAAAQDAFAQQKNTEAQQERQQIAQDQQTVINQTPPPAEVPGVLGVSILIPGTSLGRLVKLDDNTGKEIKSSTLTTVNVRTITQVGDRIFAIAGENRGNGAIRIVEIDKNTLEMLKQGDDDIAPQSLLWVNGQDLYAVTNAGGNLNLARFNTDLILQSRSSVTVPPFASVLFSGSFAATQRADGSAVLLNAQDLTEKK